MTLDDLSAEERLQLVRFVCSFAWADLEIADSEKDFVRGLVGQLKLDEDESAQVEGWLKIPPHPEDIDPNDIPAAHRQIFLSTMLQVVGADGVVDAREVESLSLLEQLLR
jgi:hypothetical protein